MDPLKHSPPFAVVIPAYNEAATIHHLVTRILAYSSLVIVVNDGSTDNTLKELDGLPIELINNSVNQGKAASLWYGIQAALAHQVNQIVTIDGDGQHAPEDITKLLTKASDNPNHIIIGARLADKSAIPAKRYYANIIANFWIAWAAGYPISDTQSGFRVYPAKLFDDLKISISKRNSFVFESEIIIKAAQSGINCRTVGIPAVYEENARPSHFNGVRDILFITAMVARSLLTRGFYLKGLYYSSIKPLLRLEGDSKLNYDGYMLLALSIVFMGLSLGGSYLISFFYVLFQALKTSTSSTNANLVILGKKLRNDLPGFDYIQRLNRAKLIAEKEPKKNIYLLGGLTGEAEISEARAGHNYLQKKEVKASKLFIEEGSRNTLENMKQLKLTFLNEDQNISLVTNRYHIARATIMAKGFGFKVQPCAAEDTGTVSFMELLNIAVEAFHLHWYYVGRVFAKLTNNKRMLSRIQ